jgi:hypothetical protein
MIFVFLAVSATRPYPRGGARIRDNDLSRRAGWEEQGQHGAQKARFCEDKEFRNYLFRARSMQLSTEGLPR